MMVGLRICCLTQCCSSHHATILHLSRIYRLLAANSFDLLDTRPRLTVPEVLQLHRSTDWGWVSHYFTTKSSATASLQ